VVIVELDERRRFIVEIWERHIEEAASFARPMKSSYKGLDRVQILWTTDMSPWDYISFLRENPWIWSVEPGWSIEKMLGFRA